MSVEAVLWVVDQIISLLAPMGNRTRPNGAGRSPLGRPGPSAVMRRLRRVRHILEKAEASPRAMYSSQQHTPETAGRKGKVLAEGVRHVDTLARSA